MDGTKNSLRCGLRGIRVKAPEKRKKKEGDREKTGNSYKSPEESPHTEHSRLRMSSRGQGGWSDEPCTSGGVSRRGGARQTAGPSTRSSTSALEEHTSGSTPCKSGFRLGVYGWRKRCLYTLVLTLTVIVIVNLALTVWLLKVMGFSYEGIGSLKVVPGGIELRGQAAVLDALVASSLRSRRGKNLVLESWSNFTASARSHDGRLLARLTVGEDRVDCVSRSFRITDPQGGLLFSADKKQVIVGAEILRVTGDGGAVFQGSVQTPIVRGESGRGLRLESATRSLKIAAPQQVVIESWANEISATCLTDMNLHSAHGAIRLDAKSVYMKGLKTAIPVQGHSSREQQQHTGRSSSSAHQSQRETSIYQLCACASGKLFLARPEGSCQADKSIC
ncbi:zeta-sarcoglycan isoform X2 [Pseudomyrmex gracilis]|uniref:zeta-sarcoglycan isoform X2 n=1 Tax=Pseudomyrmex gracilis TaxID=219809 RepID=UPI0009954228|nr:zeta-sarcoglycan isoform X2 [Pseudomyrmex gracilis]